MNNEINIYKELIDNSKDIIFWTDLNGNVLLHNNSFFKFFGTSNINVKKFDKHLKEESDWQNLLSKINENQSLYETVYVNNNKKYLPVEFYISKKYEKISFISKDITERRKYEYKIKGYTDDLIKSNNSLKEFASIASHDLKEPLRKILMFSEKLKNELKNKFLISDDKIIFYIDKISNSSKKMQEMIEKILEYSKLEASKGECSKCDLIKTINNAIENCEGSINDEIEIIVNENIQNYNIFANCNQITQVFQNLISNSIKFKKENIPLKIEIGIEDYIFEGDRILIYVKDNGIGIEKEHFEKIFKPFIRINTSSKYLGHGMGLSLCKKIINSHGGNIYIESVRNNWTKFVFDLKINKENENE